MGDSGTSGSVDLLRSELRRIGPLVVAFSGGVDSALLAWVATDTLGADLVKCVTAVSPSLAPEELHDCRALAVEWGLSYLEVETDELADPAYAANDGSRCYHCKSSLMNALEPLVVGSGVGGSIALGVNVDDLADHRPGQQAAAERGAVFPLVNAEFTKERVR
jgi:pyridinium-3,5-biscarboxylic acid mononucleotide sulfurtransferase